MRDTGGHWRAHVRDFRDGFRSWITARGSVAHMRPAPAPLSDGPATVTTWDVEMLKIEPLPRVAIPMLAGLDRREICTVLESARVETSRAGSYLMRRGDPGGDIYLFLEGRAEVRVDGRVVGVIERGYQVGEMGCVRHRRRSADVRVLEHARYLVFDAASLQALHRDHARIAAKLFRNIGHVLCDRLEHATDWLVGGTDLIESTAPQRTPE